MQINGVQTIPLYPHSFQCTRGKNLYTYRGEDIQYVLLGKAMVLLKILLTLGRFFKVIRMAVAGGKNKILNTNLEH